jgi:hypothetical protein
MYRHKIYGSVVVLSMYSDFWMVRLPSGEAKSVQPDDMELEQVAEVIPMPAQTAAKAEPTPKAEPPAPPEASPLVLVDVNKSSSTQLASAFPELSKTVWRRVKDQQSRQAGGKFADFTAFSEAVLLSTENESDGLTLKDRLTFNADG